MCYFFSWNGNGVMAREHWPFLKWVVELNYNIDCHHPLIWLLKSANHGSILFYSTNAIELGFMPSGHINSSSARQTQCTKNLSLDHIFVTVLSVISVMSAFIFRFYENNNNDIFLFSLFNIWLSLANSIYIYKKKKESRTNAQIDPEGWKQGKPTRSAYFVQQRRIYISRAQLLVSLVTK